MSIETLVPVVLGWRIVTGIFQIHTVYMEYCHNRCSKCPPCGVTNDAFLLIRDPCMRQQGVLGHTFVWFFLFCFAHGTYISTMVSFFFSETSCVVRIKYFISKNTHLEAGGYKNPFLCKCICYRTCRAPCSVQSFCVLTAVHCFLFLRSHISSCFWAFWCLLTPYYGASIELQFLHNTSHVLARLLAVF